MPIRILAPLITALALTVCTGAHAADWQAGFARQAITPEGPMWLSGYASRTKPAEGKVHDLHARAAALRDPSGGTVLFFSLDLIGVPAGLAHDVCTALEKQHGLKRADIMLTCSHTHCGPALEDRLSHIYTLAPEEAAKIPKYTERLTADLIALGSRAIADLKPARVAAGIGKTEFAANRRAPIGTGPIDQDVPVLRVTSLDGKLRGVIFGYACHNTTMSFDQYCGDYAGFAELDLEDRHPDTVALFFSGCAGDQNPLPRRKLEYAQKYGRMLALSVEEVMNRDLPPLTGPIRRGFKRIDLPFAKVPTTAELEQLASKGNNYEKILANNWLERGRQGQPPPKSYPYPIQVWRFGDQLTWIALGGEVTVGYSLRLKREIPGPVWVTGYANDVMAYIPTEQVLAEGGYEGESSMIYYQFPSKWAPGIEDRIVAATRELVEEVR
jgi:hypothetical protein